MVRHMTGDAAKVTVYTPGGCSCVESTVVGCLFCCHCCDGERLANRLAFFPPNPPSYALAQEPESGKIHARYVGASYQIMYGRVMAQFECDLVPTRRGSRIVTMFLASPTSRATEKGGKGRGNRTPGDAGSPQTTTTVVDRTPTLILSHGNAVDVALYLPFARYLRDALEVNVLAYDYTGYGCSDGHPRAAVSDVHADLEAAVRHAVVNKRCDPSTIVLYGQSIGSGPTVRYASELGRRNGVTRSAYESEKGDDRLSSGDAKSAASRPRRGSRSSGSVHPGGGAVCLVGGEGGRDADPCADPRSSDPSGRRDDGDGEKDLFSVGGVVLVSPIASGLRVLSSDEDADCCAPSRVFSACDVFPNYRLATRVDRPTLVIHGTRDVEVPMFHGAAIADEIDAEATESPAPYWVAGAGHADVFERNPPEFVAAIQRLIRIVERRANEENGETSTREDEDEDEDEDGGGSTPSNAEPATFDESPGANSAGEGPPPPPPREKGRDRGAPVVAQEMTRDG